MPRAPGAHGRGSGGSSRFGPPQDTGDPGNDPDTPRTPPGATGRIRPASAAPSSDPVPALAEPPGHEVRAAPPPRGIGGSPGSPAGGDALSPQGHFVDTRQDSDAQRAGDRKSTRLNSSHRCNSYAVFCLQKKKNANHR